MRRPNLTRLHRVLGRFYRDESGVTLLEILIVIVILGLLATLGSVQLSGYLGRARQDTAKLRMQELATALDLYRIDVGRLPSTEEGLTALVTKPNAVERWNGPYLRNKQAILDPWNRPFAYTTPGEHGDFDLLSYGADGKAGGDKEAKDIVSWQE